MAGLRPHAARVAGAAALALSACAADPEPLDRQVWLEPDAVDFGAVTLGEVASATVSIRSPAGGPGFVFPSLPEPPRDLSFTLPHRIGPSGRAALVTRFAPTQVGPIDAEIEIEVTSEGGGPEGAPTLRLSGRGVAVEVVVEDARLDFGRAVPGTLARATTWLDNLGEAPVSIGARGEDDVGTCPLEASRAFCFEALPARLAPGDRVELAVVFSPRVLGPARGSITLEAAGHRFADLALLGQGTETRLECAPAALDFGVVNPGQCAEATLDCTNTVNVPASIAEVTTTTSTFEPGAPSLDRVAPGASVEVPVRFCPPRRGPYEGAIRLLDPAGAQVHRAPVLGEGGGPDLRISPSRLDLGPGAVGAPMQRSLLIENIGDRRLSISGVNSSAPGLSADGPRQLEPGSRAVWTLEATPSEAGAWQGSLQVESNDPDSPFDVAVEGSALELGVCDYRLPSVLDLGAGALAHPVPGVVMFENVGAGDCLITRLGLRGLPSDAFRLVRAVDLPVRVSPGEARPLEVELLADRTGPHEDVLELEVSSPTRPRPQVDLRAFGAAEDVVVVPPQVDFGVLDPSCAPPTRAVHLYPTADGVAELLDARVEGSAFRLVDGPDLSGGPLRLALRSRADFGIELTPSVGPRQAGALILQVRVDGQTYERRVPLLGQGQLMPERAERFVQLGHAAVDVLFVVDFTGCMAQEQVALAAHFDALTRIMDVGRLNYHIGVTSSGTRQEQGRLLHADRIRGDPFGGPAAHKVVRRTTAPEPATVFATNVQGMNLYGGSAADESPFGAGYLALRPDMLLGHNAGFLRRDAHLSVFFLTDEPEQTGFWEQDGMPSREIDFYLDYFRALKGAEGPSSFTAISMAGDPPAGCDGAGGSASAAPRLYDFAQASGGQFQSICYPADGSSFPETFEALSSPLAGLRRKFFLGQPADPTSIEVRVDGALVPRQSSAAGWRYEPADHSIVLDTILTPEPGAELTVRYRPSCP